MAFLDDLRAHIMQGGGGSQGTGMAPTVNPGASGAPTGPGVNPSGVRTPAPRNFVAPPGAPPMAPPGRPANPGAAGFASLPPIQTGTFTGPPVGGPPLPSGPPPAAPQAPATPSPTVAGGDSTAGPDGAPPVAPDPFSGMGTQDPVSGNVILTPQGKEEYQKRMATARAAFGPYPKANDPSTPPPPITPGKLFFNPFTGTYGRA
jgi:hypothetical protein